MAGLYDEKEKKLTDTGAQTTGGDMPVYSGTFDQQLSDIYNKIANREKFNYDMNADPLYQAAKNNAVQQGKMAMQDTMGQAAGLTGGYGNTYAQKVGQQAYDASLQGLNDKIPELWNLAYGVYADQGNALAQQASLLSAQRDNEYNKWRADTSDWQYRQELARQDDATAYDRQQQAFSNLYSIIKASGYTPTDEELSAAGMTREAADALIAEYRRVNGITDKKKIGSPEPSGDTYDYSKVVDLAIKAAANGHNMNDVAQAIKDAMKDKKYTGKNDTETLQRAVRMAASSSPNDEVINKRNTTYRSI